MHVKRRRTAGSERSEVSRAVPRDCCVKGDMPAIFRAAAASRHVSAGRLVTSTAVNKPIFLSRCGCPTISLSSPFITGGVSPSLCRTARGIRRGPRIVCRYAVGRPVSALASLASVSSSGRKGSAVLGHWCSNGVCIGSWR